MEKNVHDIIGNHTSCLELRKSQLELEKTLTKANIKMNQMSLSDKNYKAAFLTCLHLCKKREEYVCDYIS